MLKQRNAPCKRLLTLLLLWFGFWKSWANLDSSSLNTKQSSHNVWRNAAFNRLPIKIAFLLITLTYDTQFKVWPYLIWVKIVLIYIFLWSRFILRCRPRVSPALHSLLAKEDLDFQWPFELISKLMRTTLFGWCSVQSSNHITSERSWRRFYK